jgi:HlyD family secretion protein
VDAFPGQTFRGEIVQIRKAPQVVQNVVTYTTVIAVSNPDRKLMPGMTASVRIQVERKDNVLRIPNAALRFRLPGESGADASGARGAARAGGAGRGAAPDVSAPARGASPDGGGGAGGGRGGPGQMRETLTRELALTPDQQTRLDAILSESRQGFAALRAQGLDDKAREVQRRRLRAEIQEKVREILTPEQRKKYEGLIAAQDGGAAAGSGAPAGVPARVYVLGADGKPQPAPIVIGTSDGSYSEVLQGPLKPGQDVVIGQGPAGGTRQGAGGGGPRLRL